MLLSLTIDNHTGVRYVLVELVEFRREKLGFTVVFYRPKGLVKHFAEHTWFCRSWISDIQFSSRHHAVDAEINSCVY